MEKNVTSLRAGIFFEILLVILPLAALLVYQTVNDLTVSDRLASSYRLHTASLAARQKYRLFLNAMADAVDTGRLSPDGVQHLKGAQRELAAISGGDAAREFAPLAQRTAVLLEQIGRDRTLPALLPLREPVHLLDRDLARLDRRFDDANRAMIQQTIASARGRRNLVYAFLIPGAIMTGVLILVLVRHLRVFEEVVREGEQRMRVMIESINAGIVLVDRQTNTVADANSAALRMYGGPKQTLVGRSCYALFAPGDPSCSGAGGKREGEASQGTLIPFCGEGIPILSSVTSVSIKGRSYLLESFVDLTEQRALENKLHAAKEAAEAASRAKSIFLASMSHEIRTPMNAILGYAQLLRREPGFSPQQVNYLEIVNRSGEHLLKLINDILEMSKIEAGSVQLTPTRFRFPEFLGEIEALFANRALQKGIAFTVHKEGELPVALWADEGKLRQVLINLVSNAMKFTDRGGIELRVSAVGAGAGETLVTVEVEDTGIGIDPQEAEKVFVPFEQTESGRRKTGGTGLGMPISREFARVMGGDLVLVASRAGEGSLFRFTFRAEAVEPPLGEERGENRPVRRLAPDEKSWRVLVVDDQETNRTLLTQVLGQAGFAVREAVDGEVGVEAFFSFRPDLVLMDILMPGIDGYEAMRRIKATPQGAETPLVAITASVLQEERQRALDAGFDGFIMKPVQMNDLFEEIRRLTGAAYLYDDLPVAPTEELGPLTPAHLVPLPPELLGRMREALEAGDMAQFRALIEQAASREPALCAALRELVDSYAYDTLTALLVPGGT